MESATGAMPIRPVLAQDRRKLSAGSWSVIQRITFRICCAYLVVYALQSIAFGPNPGSVGYSLVKPYMAVWQAIAAWVGLHLFHLTARQVGNLDVGGDVLAQWIRNLCQLAIALVAAVVWSVADRKREHYRVLHGWLRPLIRYVLAYAMFAYGFAKVFPLQFKPIQFWQLVAPYGGFTKQSILWRFMGASQLYTFFCGAVEVAGGALLLFRRTTTLGAIICCAALLNVFLLNVSYNVNVKLYSLNLLLMAGFLVIPDVKPLLQLLVFRRVAVPAEHPEPVFHSRSLRISATACWLLICALMAHHFVLTSWWYYRHYYIDPERPLLLGLWDVQSFVRNGEQLPPLMTDATRWYKVSFDTHGDGIGPGEVSVRMVDGRYQFWRTGVIRCTFDAAKNSVTFAHPDGSGHISNDTLRYSRPDPDHVLLEGRIGVAWRNLPGNATDSVSIMLRKIDTSTFPIFWKDRWIQRPR